MKTFTDNFEPIEISITDVEGKEYKIETKFVPMSKMKVIENTINQISEGKEIIEKVYSLMELLLGKNEKFWSKFSVNLLMEISQWYIIELNKTDVKKKSG